METRRRLLVLTALCTLNTIILGFSGCSRFQSTAVKPDIEEAGTDVIPFAGDSPDDSGPAWPVLAILKTGGQALWFEFAQAESGGLRQLNSAAEASLVNYEPWPLARFCAGMMASDSNLVLAVNRDGFLIVGPGEERGTVILYRAADPEYWDNYTIASLFEYESKPVVLLCSENFFSSVPAAAPESPVMTLAEEFPRPVAAKIPALDFFPKEEGWEINALRQGPDHNWYYRSIQTGNPQPVYYRTTNLSQPGVKINLGDYRNSSMPENIALVPPMSSLLAEFREHKRSLFYALILKVISPEFSGTRFFSPSYTDEEDISFIFGYYRKEPVNIAFTVLPDGQGMAFKDDTYFTFSLPPLPDGFAYTAAGLTGNVFIASWEEQEQSAVGAAGFMALDAESLGF